MAIRWLVLGIVARVAWSASPVLAQQDGAAVIGEVTDPSGGVATGAYSAEYHRSSGAVVNAVIKSGTNSLHGSAYELLRHDALDANNYFSNLLGAPKPKRRRDQFGGAAGGPLVRNRTFWFADYEGLRDEEGIPRVRLVPTADEKAGLFRSAVFDPFAPGRPEFPRNAQGQWVIPRDRWDPAAARIVALMPDPNVAGSTIYASTRATDQFDVRIITRCVTSPRRQPVTETPGPASTPQFQTPRSLNPRATFTLSRQAHLFKFGAEFLHVQTEINDLNATIGRMNFEDRVSIRLIRRTSYSLSSLSLISSIMSEACSSVLWSSSSFSPPSAS